MTKASRTLGILACIGCVLLVWWIIRQDSLRGSMSALPANQPMKAVMNDPVAFAKNHLTGGIGILLATDSTGGSVMVAQTVAGSPAQKAGLRSGDVITHVNGTTTKGQSLTQIVEDIRGFAGGSVTITVQRAGTNNLDLTVHRSSWSSLGTPIFGGLPTPTNQIRVAGPAPSFPGASTNFAAPGASPPF